MKLRHWTIAAALLLGLGQLAGAGAEEIARGGKLVFARYDDSNFIDPVYADRNPDIWMVPNLYDTLLHASHDGRGLEPGLAESWSLSDDGLTLTLKLRADLAFSDGSSLTAADVKFSLDRARDKNLGPWSDLLGSVQSIEAPDARTVVIGLGHVDPTILPVLSCFNTAVLPAKLFSAKPGATDQEKAQAFFTDGPVGSGPFVLKSWTRGSKMTLAANTHYWRKGVDGKSMPYLDEVEFQIIPDDATRVLKLQSGEVQAAEFIPFGRVDELRADAALSVALFPSTHVVYMPMNTRPSLLDGSTNPLADQRVRQALNYATDKEVLVKLVTHGAGKPLTSFMSSVTPMHVGDGALYPYDPEKAKALLADAGFGEGLAVKMTTLAGSADDATTFAAIQSMWKAVGVTLEIEQVDNATRGQKNRSGDFQIHTYGWTDDINDPAQITGFLAYFPQRQAVGTGLDDKRIAELYESSNREPDQAKRAALMAEIQQRYAEDAPLLFLYETPYAVALSKSVHDYVQSPLGHNLFVGTWLAP